MAEQTNKYETIFVLDADLDEETTNGLVEKVKSLIASNGTVDQVDVWGKRRRLTRSTIKTKVTMF